MKERAESHWCSRKYRLLHFGNSHSVEMKISIVLWTFFFLEIQLSSAKIRLDCGRWF